MSARRFTWLAVTAMTASCAASGDPEVFEAGTKVPPDASLAPASGPSLPPASGASLPPAFDASPPPASKPSLSDAATPETRTAPDLDASVAPMVSFVRVYGILAARCSPCHTALERVELDASAGKLDLSSRETAYRVLVGTMAHGPACGESGGLRVAPGDVEASLLVQKLSDAPPCGVRMPKDRMPLSSMELDEIRDWIRHGAPAR